MKKNIFIFVVVAVFVACSQDSLNDFDFEAYSSQNAGYNFGTIQKMTVSDFAVN